MSILSHFFAWETAKVTFSFDLITQLCEKLFSFPDLNVSPIITTILFSYTERKFKNLTSFLNVCSTINEQEWKKKLYLKPYFYCYDIFEKKTYFLINSFSAFLKVTYFGLFKHSFFFIFQQKRYFWCVNVKRMCMTFQISFLLILNLSVIELSVKLS